LTSKSVFDRNILSKILSLLESCEKLREKTQENRPLKSSKFLRKNPQIHSLKVMLKNPATRPKAAGRQAF
jgi:hypothetical protein